MKKGFRARVGYDGWMSEGKGMIGESVRWGKKRGKDMNKHEVCVHQRVYCLPTQGS